MTSTRFPFFRPASLALMGLLVACAQPTPAAGPSPIRITGTPAEGALVATSQPSGVAQPSSTVVLNVAQGQEIGWAYEAYLSPHQEPGEEKDMPAYIPPAFHSTTPSLLRAERPSRGHGVVRFTKDLSRAYVDVKLEGVPLAEINLFHIHCGTPDHLGEILIDFALREDLKTSLADGLLSMELTNADVEQVLSSGHGIVGALTMGCPISEDNSDHVKTIAGMARKAQLGELYFNLHTTGQTYFGDIRGQLYPMATP